MNLCNSESKFKHVHMCRKQRERRRDRERERLTDQTRNEKETIVEGIESSELRTDIEEVMLYLYKHYNENNYNFQ